VLADAKAKGATRIVTAGGIASTQVMATALFGRELGFAVTAVLFDQPVTQFARDAVRGFVAAGAELIHGGGYVRTAWRTWRALRSDPGNYLILPGAPNPLANLGYVDAIFELAGQVERGEAPRPDVIVLPTGSSGTLAALALGCAHLGWDTEVVGIRITSALACNRVTVGLVIAATDRFLAARDPRWKRVSGRVRYRLDGSELGEGYGFPTAEAIEGAAMLERLTGARGEVTYSGKALAGLRALARSPRYAGKTLLLWNTLSTPRPSIADEARVPASLRWVFDRPALA
jgi:D-cysteine desulfhydrase